MSKRKILQDHKKQGKAFIPPFIHMLGPMKEISWVKTMLPEFLWIALIQDYYGYIRGVELVTSIARIARKCSSSGTQRIFATISSFTELSNDEPTCIRESLAASGELFEIQKALLPLIELYPECPLSFLFSQKPNEVEYDLKRFKNLVKGLYDKISKDTTMVQATSIWLAFDSGMLKVSKGLALASFPEVEKYPHTELSKKVAASIRSSIYMLFMNPHYPSEAIWPLYFWNRGLEIDQCYFEDKTDE